MDRIEHEGKIVELGKDFISVEIVNKSACASCHAKVVCAASDMATRIVEVPYSIYTLADSFEVGEKVNVVMKSSMGAAAIWLCYVIPLVILMAVILILSQCGVAELKVGLWGLVAVAVWYVGIFIFKNKISKIFTFSIEKVK